jgi:hypothetical protein
MKILEHLQNRSNVQDALPYITGVLAAVLIGGVFLFATEYMRGGDSSLQRYAEEAIEACKNAVYRPSCYDEEVPKIMDEGISMEEAFEVTALIQQRDPEYWYCHVLGHNLSAKEAAKDILKWSEVVSRCPSGMCSNGCLHGAFQERFRGEHVSDEELEALIPEIDSICKIDGGVRDFTGMEQASCYHALGHLTMYITNADIDRSLSICNRVSVYGQYDFSELCYDGAFMQIFQPLEPEDIALVQDIAPQTQDQARDFCGQFSGGVRTSCSIETWPLFIDEVIASAEALTAFCERGFGKEAKRRCYTGLFYVLAPRTNFDTEAVAQMCNGLSANLKAQCYANSASRFMETDYHLAERAVELCELAEAEGVGRACFEELLFYSAYNYKAGSDSFKQLCNAFPEPWRERCVKEEGAHMRIPTYE